MAEPRCWLSGCFTVQAVNPSLLQKSSGRCARISCASCVLLWAITGLKHMHGANGRKIAAFCHVLVVCFVGAEF